MEGRDVRYGYARVSSLGQQLNGNSLSEQTNQINSFIADGVDVLIINMVQATSSAAVTELAKEAGIPVIYINREPSEDDMGMWEGKICYVGADARQSGTFQGRIVHEFNDAHGDLNGNGKADEIGFPGNMSGYKGWFQTIMSAFVYAGGPGKGSDRRTSWRCIPRC